MKLAPSFKCLVQASNRSTIQHIRIYEKKLRTYSCDAMYQKEHPASPLPYCVMGFEPLHPTETTICGSRHFCRSAQIFFSTKPQLADRMKTTWASSKVRRARGKLVFGKFYLTVLYY